MRSDRLWRYLVCVAIALLLLRLLGPAWRTGFAPPFPDSSSYIAVADAGLFSFDFWFGQRPPTYPLLIWLVGPSPRAVIVAQTLVAVAAWAWLLSTTWTQIRSKPVALVSMLMLVLIGAQTRWVFWNTALLTESLSASLAVAGVAAWWRWFAEPTGFRTWAVGAVTVAWMLSRDSNAITMLVVAAPAFAVVLWMERRQTSDRRRLMAIALTAVLVAGSYSIIAQVTTNRGETSFHNNVALRWLPDAEMSAWMQDRGMPVSDALLARAGRDAWADGEAMLSSPELAAYRDWADARGRIAAVTSFVIEADWYLERLDAELPTYTRTDHLAYDTFDVASEFPERPLRWFDPTDSRGSLYVWAVLAALATGWLWQRDRRRAWFALFIALPVGADLYLSFAADAVEVGRHLVGPMLRFSFVAVVIVALGVDDIIGRARTAPDAIESAIGSPDDVDLQIASFDG